MISAGRNAMTTRRAVDSADVNYGEDEASGMTLIDMTGWDDKPAPKPQWVLRNRIPMGHVSLFSGDGAAGKSLLQLQMSAAIVLEKEWLGTVPEQGSALFIDAEDGKDVIHE